MPNLPLCQWSSQLFDLRAPSSTDVPVLLLNQPSVCVGKNTILKFVGNTESRKSTKLTLQLVVVDLNAQTKFYDNVFKVTLYTIYYNFTGTVLWYYHSAWVTCDVSVTLLGSIASLSSFQ